MISGYWELIKINIITDMNVLHDGTCFDLDRLDRLKVRSTPPLDDLHLFRVRWHTNGNGEPSYRCV